MLSAFVSREFGFGMRLSAEDLRQVNEYRQGKHYSDRLAATEKRGTSQKQPLGSSPFVVEFEYGINTEGYWTYDHMWSCKWKIAPMSLPFSILNMTISFSLTTVVAMIESDRMVSAPTVYERNTEESNQR